MYWRCTKFQAPQSESITGEGDFNQTHVLFSTYRKTQAQCFDYFSRGLFAWLDAQPSIDSPLPLSQDEVRELHQSAVLGVALSPQDQYDTEKVNVPHKVRIVVSESS